MSPQSSLQRHGPEATHYEVLGLPKSSLEDQKDPAPLIKRAYHRALLRCHPDKALATQPDKLNISANQQAGETFSIDQISEAFAVLSDPKRKAEYDKALRLAKQQNGLNQEPNFQTGIENIDLDDLEFDPAQGRWCRGCRCGNEQGYVFGEDDLEGAADHGELAVGCQDCSLWLRVHFAVLEDETEVSQVPHHQDDWGTASTSRGMPLL